MSEQDAAPPKRPPGRPSKLDDRTREQLLTALRAGLSYAAAAQQAGVHYATLRRWLKTGEAAATGQYREVYEACKSARLDLQSVLVARIYAAGKTQWTANAWLLERFWPDEYGRKDRLPDALLLVREHVEVFAREHGLSPEDTARAVAAAEQLVRRGRLD